MTLDETLAWIGDDCDRLFDAFDVQASRPPARRDAALVSELRNRIAALYGAWPYPDTPDEEVLAGAGTRGQPAGLVLRRLEAWPAPYRRDALCEQLRARVGDDPNAYSHAPVVSGGQP